jgi:hypothetical protein
LLKEVEKKEVEREEDEGLKEGNILWSSCSLKAAKDEMEEGDTGSGNEEEKEEEVARDEERG